MRRALIAALVAAELLFFSATASAGKIEGTVTPTAIAPEVEVCLVERLPSEPCAFPLGDGTYTLTGLPTNTPLRIQFVPSYRSQYLPQYYDHAKKLTEATTIYLSPLSAERKEVDADLELGGAAEGTVTAADGRPLPEVEVCIYQAGTQTSAGCVLTSSIGGYFLGGIPTGPYDVGFRGRGESAEYASQFYDGAATFAEAEPVQITAGAVVAGLDATMGRGAAVTGTVSSGMTGEPLQEVSVCVFAAGAPAPSNCVFTGLGGAFAFAGLVPGGYQVGFSLHAAEIGGEAVPSESSGYLAQYYRGVANRAEAQVLELYAGETLGGIDAALLLPPAAPPAAAPSQRPSNLVTAPIPGSPPAQPQPLRCRKGFVKKRVRKTLKCVKAKPRGRKWRHKKHRPRRRPSKREAGHSPHT